MVQDTLLGFPAHTLPYRFGMFTILPTASNRAPKGALFFMFASYLCTILKYSGHEIQSRFIE